MGSVEAMGKSNRERSLHIRVPGSSRIETRRWNIMDWNVDSFLSFACRLASQFSPVRQISRISRRRRRGTTRIHPISVTLSKKKKKEKRGEKIEKRWKWASNAENQNRNSTRIVVLSVSFTLFHHRVSFLLRIEIKSYRASNILPPLFHVALFSRFSFFIVLNLNRGSKLSRDFNEWRYFNKATLNERKKDREIWFTIFNIVEGVSRDFCVKHFCV